MTEDDSPYTTHNRERICQGDILRDLKYPEKYLPQHPEDYSSEESDEDQKALYIPYLVVLTQDCDLEGDYRNRNDILTFDCDTQEDCRKDKITQDKFIQSILICPAYPAKILKKGEHLGDLDFHMQNFKSGTMWNSIKNNTNPRYHFLRKNSEMGVPDMVLDFKHYFTIPREILYDKLEKHYLATINRLFRELLSQRFAFYLSRIGLPPIKK
jgi:hypothetical protein